MSQFGQFNAGNPIYKHPISARKPDKARSWVASIKLTKIGTILFIERNRKMRETQPATSKKHLGL